MFKELFELCMKMLALISTQPVQPNEDITLKTPSLRERDNEREKEIRRESVCVCVCVRALVSPFFIAQGSISHTRTPSFEMENNRVVVGATLEAPQLRPEPCNLYQSSKNLNSITGIIFSPALFFFNSLLICLKWGLF